MTNDDQPMAHPKGIMIILDGLGDRPVEALDGRTPLEAAVTPHLDRMAASGLCGMMHPIAPGVPVGTQMGVGLLFGLARADVPKLTRGPVEAAGVGLNLSDGNVTFRCNLATVSPNGQGFAIEDRRAGRIREGAEALAEALDGMDLGEGVVARFRPSTQHRAVLMLEGENLSEAVTDTDPGAGERARGRLPCNPRDAADPEAERTARAVNAFFHRSHEILRNHPVNAARVAQGLPPANGVLTRGAGKYRPIRNLVRHLGLRAAVVAEDGAVVGLSRLFGFDVIRDPRFTALADTDLDAKVAAGLHALDDHDLVFIHIKGADTCAHDHDPVGKKAFIERIDAALAPLLDRGLALAVTGDHTTDSRLGRHTGDPVPALVTAPHGRVDAVRAFSESDCMRGGLGALSANAFLSVLLDLMDRTHILRAHEAVFF
jgi:2,3-bisphosphoglycerate-independent phosphoglycerate mutase